MEETMSSEDPCKCEATDPGYGGICKHCGKECFRQEGDAEGPEEEYNPYRCYECRNLVLYRVDHKPECKFFVSNNPFIGRSS